MSVGTGFPYILYDLLKKESSAIVMWTSTGTAFGIRDMTSFRQDVLTCYFKHNKFSSFQRQLNLYGFRKVVKGRESGCYMHPSFLRDNPEKLSEVKRGVVPPCPPCYSRKIYGSGPRFMSQDDDSDSEPELVVQARGHWEKSVGPADVATHIRLGEMHMSAAAFGAARAQIQGEGGGGGLDGGHTAAAAAAAVHHLQVAQAHIHGVPAAGGEPRVVGGMPSMDMVDASRGLGAPPADLGAGGRMEPHGMGGGGGGGGGDGGGGGGYGGGGGGGGGDSAKVGRSRSGRMSKLFGGGMPQQQQQQQQHEHSPSSFLRGSSSGSLDHSPRQLSSGSLDVSPRQQQMSQPHMQQQQQQQHDVHQMQPPRNNMHHSHSNNHHQQQHNQMHRFGGAPPQGGGGGGGGGGDLGYLPPLAAPGGQQGGMPMGGPGVKGISDGRPGQTPTVTSLSRLLENLEHSLESPSEEEQFTPIDKRNSFYAHMVDMAQILEEDPSMQGMEDQTNNNRFSYLAQKRRSSVSELAAYIQDMLEDGESNRMIANTPGWTLPPLPPPPTGNGGGGGGGGGDGSFPAREGNGNRVTFKRTAPEDFERYGDYGMDGSGHSGAGAGGAGGGRGDNGAGAGANARGGPGAGLDWAGGAEGDGRSQSFNSLKRARGEPSFPEPLPAGGGIGRHGRRMSAARMNAKVAASPTMVQALTCIASGLPESDSEEDAAAAAAAAAVDGSGGGGSGRGSKASSLSPSGRGGSGSGSGGGSSTVKKEEPARTISPETAFRAADEPAAAAAAAAEAAAAAQAQQEGGGSMPMLPPARRRGSKAITDVVTKFSIDQAVEQFKAEEGGGPGGGGDDDEDGGGGGGGGGDGPAGGGGRKNMQRASVYVLMHAIAAVDTANDEAFGDEEPLDGVEEVATAEAAI